MNLLKKLLTSLKDPFNALTFVVAVVGMIEGIWLYNLSIPHRKIGHEVVQIKISDSSFTENVGKLSPSSNLLFQTPLISVNTNIPIKNNIYAATISIWNAGDTIISKDDIQTQYRLIFDAPNYSLIGSFVTYATSHNNDGFSVASDTGDISWEKFYPNEGFEVFVVYSSDKMQNFSLKGKVFGNPDLISLQDSLSYLEPFNVTLTFYFLSGYAVMCVIAISGLFLIEHYRPVLSFDLFRTRIIASTATIFAVLILIETIRLAAFQSLPTKPPFTY